MIKENKDNNIVALVQGFVAIFTMIIIAYCTIEITQEIKGIHDCIYDIAGYTESMAINNTEGCNHK